MLRNGEYFMNIRSFNPGNGQLIREFEASTKEDVEAAVNRAQIAQKSWGALSLEQREKYFRRLAEVLNEKSQKILDVIKEETGKRIPDGQAELYDVIDAIEYYLGKMSCIHPDISLKLNDQAFPDTDFVLDYVPYGVVGLIMPWNFSFYSPMMFVLAATIAGNTVVLKPSEYSTLVGLSIKEMFEEAGFPESVLEIAIGAEDTGKYLVKAAVNKIFFVGSVEAGKHIIANAGITPVQVELGGNSSALVLNDADLDLAAQGIAWGATYHSGQDCVGIKRVFVEMGVAEDFINKLVVIVNGLRPGIDYGPYITSEAMKAVKTKIDDAVNKGAELICGGKLIEAPEGKGNWLSPSVLIIPNQNIELVAEETFGNTIPIMIVPDAETAVREANNSNYGLSNAIFTKNLKRAKDLARKLESGMVFINEPFIAIPGWDHWTGWKDSGFGTVESKIMQCLKKKVLSANLRGQSRGFWYPYPDA